MPYVLGIDIGDSFTSAALCRRDGAGWSEPEAVRLGARSPAVASLIQLSPHGTLLTGDGVSGDTAADPGRIMRGFNRRVGDDVPMIVDGLSYRPEDLMAALVRLVVDRVREQEDDQSGQCEHIVLAHPAGWGPHRQGLLFTALRDAGLEDVGLVASPVAAATSFAEPAAGPLAGLDLGGTTCTAFAVARTGRRSLELLAYEEHPAGGGDLDDALVGHVRATVGWDSKDVLADPGLHPAMALLRRGCTTGRERLSGSTEALIPIPWAEPEAGQALHALHSAPREIVVGRAVLEELIRPALAEAVAVLERLVRAGERAPAGVVLVGGTARTPLVADLVSATLPVPVLTDHDPQTTVARGAALTAARGGRR